jgi:cytochrome c
LILQRLAVAIVCCFVATSPLHAQDDERGTAKQAQTMVERAIIVFEDEGAANAFDEFNAGPPPFRNRDLYIFVIDGDGLVLANAQHPDRVGRNLIDMKDANDVPLIRRMVEQATENGVWVDYLFEDPLTGQVAAKSSWVVRHGGYVFGCGIYKP